MTSTGLVLPLPDRSGKTVARVGRERGTRARTVRGGAGGTSQRLVIPR
ncbi:MAG TPA: hypothetical protein VGG75_40565 [Trebonia sp.]